MVKIYHENDADLSLLDGKTIAIIGYGLQGSAQAMCMKDTGANVIIGARPNGPSWNKAKEYGFEVYEIPEASKRAEIIYLLVPDEWHEQVYKEQIEPYMEKCEVFCVSHAFSIIFGQVVPPDNVDIIMVAPKAPGKIERRLYCEGFGAPALIAVEQDVSGKAKDIALALCKANGFTRAGVIETKFYDEVTSDLFGEQAVLCGGLHELIKTGFDLLVENGYDPVLAYFECLNECKLIMDLIYEGGIEGMWNNVSNTAEYGGRTRGESVINKAAMEKILKDVRSGKFAQEWISEYKANAPSLKVQRVTGAKEQIEIVGKEVRKLFEKK